MFRRVYIYTKPEYLLHARYFAYFLYATRCCGVTNRSYYQYRYRFRSISIRFILIKEFGIILFQFLIIIIRMKLGVPNSNAKNRQIFIEGLSRGFRTIASRVFRGSKIVVLIARRVSGDPARSALIQLPRKRHKKRKKRRIVGVIRVPRISRGQSKISPSRNIHWEWRARQSPPRYRYPARLPSSILRRHTA